MTIPTTQAAVQLVGPSQLFLNLEKPLPELGPRHILVQSEAVGLCFSDMKLLAQFSGHVRKSEVVSGIAPEVLRGLPSYAPGELPTVPGHEVACRVVAVGSEVTRYRVGDRFIVQADYRPMKTASSNGAFGYNFEGGLQEFVLLDERIAGDPQEEASFMIPVPGDRPASQLALVEPWACVENSYATPERQRPLPGGAAVTLRSGERLGEGPYDDIVLLSPTREDIEAAAPALAKNGVIALVQEGRKIGEKAAVDVGRLHYMGQRWVGSLGGDPEEAYRMIPSDGELRPDDRVLVVGAGGPMGQMHSIRSLAVTHGEVVLTDTSQERLEALAKKLKPWEGRFRTLLSSELSASETFNAISLMAPVPALVEDAIQRSRPGAKVNVFAGIPIGSTALLDLDRVIEQRIFLFGTSGSEPRDMRVVLDKVLTGKVDTNLSVAAVSGMAGAIDGLHAVEKRTLEGKIVVYPSLREMPLIPLEELGRWYPTVAALLADGQWTGAAEAELLRVAS